MDYKKAIETIKSNYPPENYTMLREALDLAINAFTENEKLQTALEFYASEKTYRLGVMVTMGSAFPLHEPIKSDLGEIARKALGESN